MRARPVCTIALFLAAMLLCGRSLGQDVASAKAFVASVYTHYGKNAKGMPFTSQYLHSSLLALMDADEKAAKQHDEMPGALDGDPMCDCQDWDGIWDLKTDIELEDPSHAEATVSFSIFGPTDRTNDSLRKLRITLVPEHGAWRIYDVITIADPGTKESPRPSFRHEIQNDIDEFARESKSAKP